MHIFFSGIGGTGIGPLALIAKQAGYEVSGSDKQDSQYISYLRSHGIEDIHIGQTKEAIAEAHAKKPIDWYVYSSSVAIENPNHPELSFVRSKGVKNTKRDELLNEIIRKKSLKLVAVAGTHGKSTTTAMLIWIFKELGLPVSYSVGAKIGFGEMGQYEKGSEYFLYECDEFDRNFLAFSPYLSLITGVAWDHHEVFPTFENYQDAFKEFVDQSNDTVIWSEDAGLLGVSAGSDTQVIHKDDPRVSGVTLAGSVNRQNAWEVVVAVESLTHEPLDKLVAIINRFPGLDRRMEQIVPNLYSDYAHNPEKIVGAMQTALEMAKEKSQQVVVIYEPLTNRRMHFTREQHRDVFNGASQLYWVPSYLAREDPAQPVLSPEELIRSLSPEMQERAQPMKLDEELKKTIYEHVQAGDLVVAMSGGGGNSLDEWLRKEFK